MVPFVVSLTFHPFPHNLIADCDFFGFFLIVIFLVYVIFRSTRLEVFIFVRRLIFTRLFLRHTQTVIAFNLQRIELVSGDIDLLTKVYTLCSLFVLSNGRHLPVCDERRCFLEVVQREGALLASVLGQVFSACPQNAADLFLNGHLAAPSTYCRRSAAGRACLRGCL